MGLTFSQIELLGFRALFHEMKHVYFFMVIKKGENDFFYYPNILYTAKPQTLVTKMGEYNPTYILLLLVKDE